MAQDIKIGEDRIEDIPDNLAAARSILWLSPDASVQDIMRSLSREMSISNYAIGLSALQVDAILTLVRKSSQFNFES